MYRNSPEKITFITTLTVAVVIFALALIGGDRFYSKPHPDFLNGYYPGALNLQLGKGYLDTRGNWITRWPPGFSLLISPFVAENFNETVIRLRWVAGFLAAFNVFLLAWITRLLTPCVSLWILLPILVFWPPLLPMLSPVSSELFFMALLNLVVLLLIKFSSGADTENWTKLLTKLFAVGVLFGAIALTRTVGIAIFAAALIAITLGLNYCKISLRLSVVLILVIGFSIPTVSWMAKVNEQSGEFTFTTNGNYSIWTGLKRFPQYEAGKELIKLSRTNASPGQAFVQTFNAYPISTAYLVINKFFRPWHSTSSGKFDSLLKIFNLPVLLLFIAAGIRSLWIWNRLPFPILLMLGIVSATWLSAFFVHSLFRYMAPVFPLVFLVIAWHIKDARKTGKANR